MSLLQKTLKLLQSYNISIRKSLSQNFLIDFSLLERLLIYACVTEEDIVLEIGAGLGYLTKLLSEKCKKVIAIAVHSSPWYPPVIWPALVARMYSCRR